MFVWPANSWFFWVAAAVGVGVYFGVILCLPREQGVSRKRSSSLGVLLAGVIVLTALVPSLLFAALSTTGFDVAPVDAAWWSISALVGIAALVLGAWALFADRSRGRKRCPKCWYDMSGTPTLACPECGKSAKSERRLYKTRRRKWCTALAVLLLLGAVCGAGWPTARDANWEKATPDWVLLLAMPHLDGDEWMAARLFERAGWYGDPLVREIADETAPAWKRRFAVWRCRSALSEGGTRFGAMSGLWLASGFTDREASQIADAVLVRCKDEDTEIRSMSIEWLGDHPVHEPEVRALAIELLGDPQEIVRHSAKKALAATAERQSPRPPPPRELIAIAKEGTADEAWFAMWALGFHAPTPEVIDLLENALKKDPGRKPLGPLVQLAPESFVAQEVALQALQEEPDQIDRIARVLLDHNWENGEVEAALVKAVQQLKRVTPVAGITTMIASEQRMPVARRLELLLRIGESDYARGLIAGSVRYFGREGKTVLAKLRQVAWEWEQVDPIAANSLRDSIREIESLPE